jgi:hypothetical protein
VVRVSLRAQGSNQALAFDSGSLQLQDRLIQAAAFASESVPIVGSIIAAILALVAAVVSMIGTLIGQAIGESAGDSTGAATAKDLNYEVTVASGGSNVEVVVSWPTGPIDWGCFNICIVRPAAPAPPIVTDIQPRFGSNGALVHITGRGFGENPDNLSLAVRRANSSVLLRAISASDTEIIAEVGTGDPNELFVGPVALTLGLGKHKQGYSFPLIEGIPYSEPTIEWSFANMLPPTVQSTIDFTVYPGCRSYGSSLNQAMNSGPPQDGKLCLVVPPGLGSINRVSLNLQANNERLNIARALHLVRWFGPGGPPGGAAKAKLFCDYIAVAFADQGIAVNCTVSELPNGEARLCFSLPEGDIDWGHLRICLEDQQGILANGAGQAPKLEVSPFSASSLLQLSLPRSLTGYEVEVTDDLLGSPPGHVNWVPITLPVRATDTELQMTLPTSPGQPGLFFRLSKPAAGRGSD